MSFLRFVEENRQVMTWGLCEEIIVFLVNFPSAVFVAEDGTAAACCENRCELLALAAFHGCISICTYLEKSAP